MRGLSAYFPILCLCLNFERVLPVFLERYTTISNSSSGYITSPYYPALYLNNMKRSWKIKVPEGQRVRLEFSFLNLQGDRHCKTDLIIVKDFYRSRTYNTYCGNVLPTGYLSSRDMVWVEFVSDGRNVGTGFKIRYQAVIGKIWSFRYVNCFYLLR